MPDVYLTIADAAERLLVSDDKIRSLIHTGALPCIRMGHRTVRISENSLNAYLATMNTRKDQTT